MSLDYIWVLSSRKPLQKVPDLIWFDFVMVRDNVRNCSSGFGSCLRLAICSTDTYFAGQYQQAAAPSQPHTHEGKQLIHLQPLFST